jgi:hypothetical protein
LKKRTKKLLVLWALEMAVSQLADSGKRFLSTEASDAGRHQSRRNQTFLPLPAAGFFFSKKKRFLPFANDF